MEGSSVLISSLVKTKVIITIQLLYDFSQLLFNSAFVLTCFSILLRCTQMHLKNSKSFKLIHFDVLPTRHKQYYTVTKYGGLFDVQVVSSVSYCCT